MRSIEDVTDLDITLPSVSDVPMRLENVIIREYNFRDEQQRAEYELLLKQLHSNPELYNIIQHEIISTNEFWGARVIIEMYKQVTTPTIKPRAKRAADGEKFIVYEAREME